MERKVEAMVAAIRVLMCLPCISWWSRRANEGHPQLAWKGTIAGRLYGCPTRSQWRNERCQWLAAAEDEKCTRESISVWREASRVAKTRVRLIRLDHQACCHPPYAIHFRHDTMAST